MAVIRVTINYQHSADPAKFGKYNLCLSDEMGLQQNVELKFNINDLWRFARDTSSVAFDFLIFAMSVYNADRAVNRSKYSEEGWKRNILLQVPVINVAAMERGLHSFRSAVDFLTGDDWDFEFVQAEPYNYAPPCIQFENLQDYAGVSLFSGGLDSLIGFIDGCSLLPTDKKMLLISHAELGKEGTLYVDTEDREISVWDKEENFEDSDKTIINSMEMVDKYGLYSDNAYIKFDDEEIKKEQNAIKEETDRFINMISLDKPKKSYR